mmetsp:Transcript_9985/g.15074  ORF Transcript_9985/g.15074 Transcript_9985/m.15074 type:complete len:256 (+) Transcript_9985:35-802(+)
MFYRGLQRINRTKVLGHVKAQRRVGCPHMSLTQARMFSYGGERQQQVLISWPSLGLLALLCGGTVAYFEIEKEKRKNQAVTDVTSVGKPALGGPFVMFDQDGLPVTDASFRGKYMLLYFGFTHCPDICPSELVKVGKVMDEVERRKLGTLKPVFISVDPARDTIGQLKHYSQDFHKSFSFLTGTKDQIAEATRAFRVYFSKVDDNDDVEEEYLVDHSIVLYLIGPDGEFLDFYTQRLLVSDIVDSIAKHMATGKK